MDGDIPPLWRDKTELEALDCRVCSAWRACRHRQGVSDICERYREADSDASLSAIFTDKAMLSIRRDNAILAVAVSELSEAVEDSP